MTGRSLSFGEDADAYDRTRPTYPEALIDELVSGGAVEVLDVGCGTGKLGCLLAARGCRVLGVEPDARMAAVARGHGLAVEIAPFESWDDGGRRFDLVVAAQAWHWVDADAGARKAAEVLRVGGRLAVVWNLTRHEPDVKAALDAVYEREAPELRTSVVLGVEVGDEPLAGLEGTGAFGCQERHVYRWQQGYTTAEWLDQLPTHSDHRALPAERRASLLAGVTEVLDGLGGQVTVTYHTLLLTAPRR